MSPDTPHSPTTLLDLVRWALTDFDPVEALDVISDHCVKMLPAMAGGVLLIDHSGHLRLAGASHHSAEVLDLLQLESGTGPCIQSCRSATAVVDTELSPDGPWPTLATEARRRGFVAIYALPLMSRGVALGALNLFCNRILDGTDLELAQTLADIATVMVLQADPHDEHLLLARTLRRILEARATLEQAKGVIAARYGITPDAAFDRLRSSAEGAGLSVSSLADQILSGLHKEPLAPPASHGS